MTIHLILALIWAACCQDSSLYYRQQLSMERGASCLDGTNPIIYVHKGTNQNKFLLFFEQGGFCQGYTFEETLSQCYQRSLTDLGSTSNTMPTKSFDGQGVLSTLQEQNPTFYDWMKVILTYCDGSAFLGNRDEPFQYLDHRLFFRGEKNVREAIRHLDMNYDIFDKEQIVIAGVEVGGIAALAYSDYFFEQSRSSQVLVLPDSSLFLLDFEIKEFEIATSQLARMVLEIQSVPAPVQNCLFNNYGFAGRCFSPINYFKSVRPSAMIIQSTYDFNTITNILKAECLTKDKPHSLANCSQMQIHVIESYRIEMLYLFEELSEYGTSLWSPSCVQHGFLNNPLFSDVNYTASGVSLSEAVSRFVNNPQTLQKLLDKQSWSGKVGCNRPEETPKQPSPKQEQTNQPEQSNQGKQVNQSQQLPCFAGKKFQLGFKEDRLLIIEGGNLFFRGCPDSFHEYTLKIDPLSPNDHRIQLKKTASGDCRDMLVFAYEKAIERAATYSVVSEQSDEHLQIYNQNGRLELLLKFKKRRTEQTINKLSLQGFYTMYLPAITIDFTGNGRIRIDICDTIDESYLFDDGMLHFDVSQSSFWQCTDPFTSYIHMIMSSSRFSIDHCSCHLQKNTSQGSQYYTLIAKQVVNSSIDLFSPAFGPSSILGDYMYHLNSSSQVPVSIQQTTIYLKGCNTVRTRYSTSKGNKIVFEEFEILNRTSCPNNHDAEYIEKLRKASQYEIISGTGLTFLDQYGFEVLTLYSTT